MNNSKFKYDFSGFSKLNLKQRLAKLMKLGYITDVELALLRSTQKLPIYLAENFIENAIGYFELPLGVAVNFCIDGKELVIPMAIEETSVIAACSKTAKWIKQSGEIITKNITNLAIGQIQFNKVENFAQWKKNIIKHKDQLIRDANNTVAHRLYQRGGGLKDIQLRKIIRPDGDVMGIIHLLIHTCDAMGANSINQICQYLKPSFEKITKNKVLLCILSNLTNTKLTEAKIIIHNVDPTLGTNIQEAALFAQLDPYRAATNNKGILNGIDSVLIATGNDWRAVEAGIHSYAATDGTYKSISQWKLIDNDLIGSMKVPINLGIVGGVTRLHPMAKLSLSILNVNSANELARIVAAVGLVQNLGALHALVTQGICHGHMKLHLNNICASLNVKKTEKAKLMSELGRHLNKYQYISYGIASDLLNKIREKQNEHRNQRTK